MSDRSEVGALAVGSLSVQDRHALELAEVMADLADVATGFAQVVNRLEPIAGFASHRATAQGLLVKCHELRADVLEGIDAMGVDGDD